MPAIEQAIAAAAQGNLTEVREDAGKLPLRVALPVLDVLQRTGLSREEIQRFLARLQQVLGNEELVTKLPSVHGRPDLKVYRTVLGRPEAAMIFRFVLVPLPPPSAAVVVLNCSSRRERSA
jgi:hypothetical protein